MADNILRIGAEFDVSKIIAGTEQASVAINTLSSDIQREAEMFQNAGLTVDEAAASLETLGYSHEEVVAALKAETPAIASDTVATEENTAALLENAAASEAAAAGSRSHAEANIQARLTTDILTGNISRAENALIRFASHSSLIGPLIQAAFLPFAAVAFVEILGHLYESFQKLSDGVMGYTAEVKKAYAEDVKFSEAAMGHALTLTGAEAQLTSILREQGEAAQSFGDRFGAAYDRAAQSHSAFVDSIPILGEAIVLYEGLAHAESDAADQAIKLNAAQRSLMIDVTQKTIDQDREAIKLIGDRVAAENAGLTGNDARVTQIRNEIVALQDKQKVEEDLAVHEAGMKALREGGNAVAAENQARTNVDEEYYYKRIQLTSELSTAEQEAAEKNAARNYESIAFYSKYRDDQLEIAQKEAESEQKMYDEESRMFSSSQLKDVDATIKATEEEIRSREKYRDESLKITEQVSLANVSAEEAKVSATASLDRDKLSSVNEITRLKITEQINQQELADLEKLEDEKLAVQLKYLEEEKSILLAGRTPEEFATGANPEELTASLRLNGEIEAAQQAHAAKMADYNRQMVADSQKTADAQVNAYMKAFQPINRAMDGMVNGILQGTLTIQQAFVRMGANIALTTIDALAQMTLKWAEHELAVTVAHLVGTQTRVAATATAAGETKAITASTGFSEIVHAAAVAAAHTYAAVSAIPIVGPFLAPPAAAGAFAAVVAFESLAGAESGAEIPTNMPLFVHAGETVAPKPLSAEMHSLVPNIQKFNMAMNAPQASAPAAAGTSSSSISNISIQAFDASSLRDFAHKNQRQFVAAARGMIRNGAR